MDNKIYYISQYDNNVHNINDVEHRLIENKDDNEIYDAYIGKDCGSDGFRVDEEVNLYGLKEIFKFYEL